MVNNSFYSTSKKEIRDILIAWFVLSVSLAIVFRWNNSPPSLDILISIDMGLSLLISLLTVGPAFILHEVSHKMIAQRFGYWAEFRMQTKMLFFSLFVAYAGGVVFAAPGAVRIFGRSISTSENGRISLAGPVANIFTGILFLPLSFMPNIIGRIGVYGVFINFFLAAFNLLPFSILDGKKIKNWSIKIYFPIFLISIILVIFSFLYVI
ncbi:MAG: Zn-dependent protease [Candidatus Methanohalarchaeum thermophilum]|uniref:Zn-dependent protease n=1 Tax=Methanohalarchaeum thermophilum TaxID=1903181 RepID=A0A1Q6DUF5_METT1|nr:MAG: Zn-dependent protease [Candidatus Methanohalarchaeum thermophilum]